MVFLTSITRHWCRGVDKYFKSRQRFRLAWRHYGRPRNVNRFVINSYMRSLRFSFWGRGQKYFVLRKLYDQRLEGAAMEHGVSRDELLEGLARCNVLLDRKVLQDLAIYEPRTFKSICATAKAGLADSESLENESAEQGLSGISSLSESGENSEQEGVVTRINRGKFTSTLS